MKHTTILAFFNALILACSCDPAIDGYDIDDAVPAAETLKISATPVTVNGQNSNEIIVENNSPVPSQWTLEQMGTIDKVSTRSQDKLIATHTGVNEVKFRSYNATDGTTVERTLQVQVDKITTVPDYLAERLCIGQEGGATGFDSELDFSKIQIIPEKDAEGRAGNRITFRNPNNVLTEWHFGKETSDKNIAELYVLSLGDNALSATFTLADGTKVEHEFPPVHVETFTFKPEFLVNLTGDSGTKTWTWKNATASFGLGGYGGDGGWGSHGPDYAQMDLTTLGYIGGALGIGDECSDAARMTFSVTGELTVGHRTGTYAFDLDAAIPGWRIGTLTTKGVTVLYGRQFALDPTNPIGVEIHVYDIVEATPNGLILCGNMGGGMGTFFVFKPAE